MIERIAIWAIRIMQRRAERRGNWLTVEFRHGREGADNG